MDDSIMPADKVVQSQFQGVAPLDSMNTMVATSAVTRAVSRLDCIDAARGLVMVLMALDHVREFLPTATFNPLDPAKTTLALYLTRWLTHFCAPTFAFLAGMGVGLAEQRGATRSELSSFLLKRGIWLIALEITVIWWLGWDFWIDPRSFMLTVIWMLGASMITLAGLMRLPRPVVGAIALGLIFGHNALDTIRPDKLGLLWGDLWKVLHVPGPLELPQKIGLSIGTYYPLVPWIGVVAAGYLVAGIMMIAPGRRRRIFTALGLGSLAVFLLLRGLNLYGDPGTWSRQGTAMRTVFSFLNCQKYPPSLCYLLMTLGPLFLLIAVLDRGIPRALRPVIVFGRVPLFYYLLHVPLIHSLVVVTCLLSGQDVGWLFGFMTKMGFMRGAEHGTYPLGLVYVLWLVALAILYPACQRFADWKRTNSKWWARYL